MSQTRIDEVRNLKDKELFNEIKKFSEAVTAFNQELEKAYVELMQKTGNGGVIVQYGTSFLPIKNSPLIRNDATLRPSELEQLRKKFEAIQQKKDAVVNEFKVLTDEVNARQFEKKHDKYAPRFVEELKNVNNKMNEKIQYYTGTNALHEQNVNKNDEMIKIMNNAISVHVDKTPRVINTSTSKNSTTNLFKSLDSRDKNKHFDSNPDVQEALGRFKEQKGKEQMREMKKRGTVDFKENIDRQTAEKRVIGKSLESYAEKEKEINKFIKNINRNADQSDNYAKLWLKEAQLIIADKQFPLLAEYKSQKMKELEAALKELSSIKQQVQAQINNPYHEDKYDVVKYHAQLKALYERSDALTYKVIDPILNDADIGYGVNRLARGENENREFKELTTKLIDEKNQTIQDKIHKVSQSINELGPNEHSKSSLARLEKIGNVYKNIDKKDPEAMQKQLHKIEKAIDKLDMNVRKAVNDIPNVEVRNKMR